MTRRSTDWVTGQPVRRGWEFKRPPRVSFSTVLWHSLKTLHLPAFRDQFGLLLGPISGCGVIFDKILRLGFHLWTGLDFGSGRVPLCLRAIFWFCSFPARLGLIWVGLLSLPSHFSSPSIFPFFDFGWLLKRRRVLPGLRASTLLSPLYSLSKPRLAERRGTTPHSLVRMKTISATSKNLLRGK